MVSKEDHPQMAELFRLVTYYNLPRYVDWYYLIMALQVYDGDSGLMLISNPKN
jgi:hypothetical protein